MSLKYQFMHLLAPADEVVLTPGVALKFVTKSSFLFQRRMT
jgi:hypothetical protein